jgi:hypothetical protein
MNLPTVSYEGVELTAAFHSSPFPWSDFPAECGWYVFFVGVLHLVVLGVGALILAFLSAKHPGQFLGRMLRLAVFLGVLLVAGAVLNGLWSCLIYGQFYNSSDYDCGFLPFWPFTKYWMEMRDSAGELMDVPLQMHFIWLFFTASTWVVTIVLFRLIFRLKQRCFSFGAKPAAKQGLIG